MSGRIMMPLLAGLCGIALTVGTGEAGEGSRSSLAGVVTFTAHDYGYQGPDRIPAGMTTVEVVNQGQDLHHAQLVKLAAGKTADEFISALKADPRHWPGWVSFVGGPNGVVPGDRATAAVMLGMEKPLTVVPVSTVSWAEPVADLTITQRDFHFELSKPITAGTHTIEVTNAGGQPHEAVVVQLAPGATVKDFVAAFEPGATGPPPGRPMGGIVGLDRGGRGFFTATFDPGHYAIICFFPDQTTGREHVQQGMVREFTVH